jgi:hypothetical protein
MIHRSLHAALAAAAVLSVSLPTAALADGKTPFTLGIGKFISTSPSSSVEGFAPFPGTSVRQRGDIGIDFSFGRDYIPGGYQITAMFISQHQSVLPAAVNGAGPQDMTITQIPIMFESSGTQVSAVRFGGGIGYDFVSYPASNGARAGSGLLGETFVDVGVGSGAALEAKYFFGQRAALSGVYIGVKTRL